MPAPPRRVAVLLCAGYGTRLAAVSGGRPKPLLPVGGRPVLDHLADRLAALRGFDEVHLVTNAVHAGAFAEWAATRPAGAIVVHDDGTRRPEERLGAVGDLAFVLGRIGRLDGALVAAGDNVLLFSLAALWEPFLARGGCHVLALPEDDPARLRRTGVLELGDGDVVAALHEKPATPPSRWTCPPFYALDAAALATVPAYLATGGPRDEIGRFVAHLATTREVYAHRVDGRRLDVGTPESWRAADAELRQPEKSPPAPLSERGGKKGAPLRSPPLRKGG